MLSALRETLEQADGFAVVGTAASGLQVEPLVSRTRPDLVLLDLMLPGLDGLSCLALLRERHPQATVVVLSGQDDDETIEKALLGGATAYVNKSIDPADLPVLLRQALLGNVRFAAPRLTRDLVTQAALQSRYDEARSETGLTPRELEILEAVARGLSNRAVGQRVVPLGSDGQVPPAQDLPEAQGGEPHRGGPDRAPAGARRERRHSCLTRCPASAAAATAAGP